MQFEAVCQEKREKRNEKREDGLNVVATSIDNGHQLFSFLSSHFSFFLP
jgi:hypothetical protein